MSSTLQKKRKQTSDASSSSSSSTLQEPNQKQNNAPPQQKQERFFAHGSLEHVSSVLYGMIHTPVVPSFERDLLLDRFHNEIIKRFQFGCCLSGSCKQNDAGGAVLGSSLRSKKTHGRKRRRKNRTTKKLTEEEPSPSKENVSIKDDSLKSSHRDKPSPNKSAKHNTPQEENLTTFLQKQIIKSRIIFGTNQCTRTLQKAMQNKGPIPLLIMLARNVRPPTILAHLIPMAKHCHVPVLLFPGMTSMDLGKMLGVGTVGVVLILPREGANDAVTVVSGGGGISEKQQKQEKQEQTRKLVLMYRYHKWIDSFVEFAKTNVPSTSV